jgi:hypothetical protein
MQLGSGGSLLPGDTVDLGRFRAGTNLGFYLIANGYRPGWTLPGDAPADRVLWTLDELNTDGARHAVLVQMAEMLNGRDAFLLGFEDLPINRADRDYNDLMFVVQASSDAAIDGSGVLSSPLRTRCPGR